MIGGIEQIGHEVIEPLATLSALVEIATLFGLSRVSVPVAVLGTAIGFAPWTALWSYFGNKIFVWIGAQTASTWIGIALVIVLIVILRRHRVKNGETDTA